jgi:hypothetical protein
LRHAIRSLDRDGLERLLEYESAQADRVLVKEILAARVEELATGANPSSGGRPPGPPPDGPGAGSPVRPETAAPATKSTAALRADERAEQAVTTRANCRPGSA